MVGAHTELGKETFLLYSDKWSCVIVWPMQGKSSIVLVVDLQNNEDIAPNLYLSPLFVHQIGDDTPSSYEVRTPVI